MKPKVNMRPVASHYAMPDERIIEVSTKTAGCLISIREHDGALVIDVYRPDGHVEVRSGGTPTLAERDALAAMVAYCWDDEQTDYEEQAPEERSGHVYESLATLARYLERTRG